MYRYVCSAQYEKRYNVRPWPEQVDSRFKNASVTTRLDTVKGLLKCLGKVAL